jgi:hypothetical protein
MEITAQLPQELQNVVYQFYKWKYSQEQYNKMREHFRKKHQPLFQLSLMQIPYLPYQKVYPSVDVLPECYITLQDYADSKYQECSIQFRIIDGCKEKPVIERKIWRTLWKEDYHTISCYDYETPNFRSLFFDEYWNTKKTCLSEHLGVYIYGSSVTKTIITETVKYGTLTGYHKVTVLNQINFS